MMYQLLKELFALEWSHQLALKGGTLAYFLYNLDRFSTDLDIDCLHGLPDKQQTKEIQQILKKHGNIREFQQFKHMHRYVFSYGEQDHNIKLEFNARIRVANQYEVVSFFGSPMHVMEKGTIFANKLVTVMDRKKPTSRDLRDVHFFFAHHFPINNEVITERTMLSMQDFLIQLKAYIQQNFTSRKVVDANLGVVLDEKQKAWARASLIQEIVHYIEQRAFDLGTSVS